MNLHLSCNVLWVVEGRQQQLLDGSGHAAALQAGAAYLRVADEAEGRCALLDIQELVQLPAALQQEALPPCSSTSPSQDG